MSRTSSSGVFLCIAALSGVACGSDEAALFGSADAATETQDGPRGAAGSANAAGTSSGGSGNGGSGSEAGDSGASGSDDAGSDGPANGGGAGGGGGEPDGASGPGDSGADACANKTRYYPDTDNDTFGTVAGSVLACSPPSSGRWVLRSGDCNDQDSRVRPGQDAYFGTPYSAAGVQSFDYDCSNSEQDDPSQSKAPENCGLLSLALCAGSGYTKTARTGEGVSPYCGSGEIGTCRAALGLLLCEMVTEAVAEPFRCK